MESKVTVIGPLPSVSQPAASHGTGDWFMWNGTLYCTTSRMGSERSYLDVAGKESVRVDASQQVTPVDVEIRVIRRAT